MLWNFRAVILLAAAVEGLKISLIGLQISEDRLWDIAKDFPLLVLFSVVFYFVAKWMVKLLEDQRQGLREVYENNQRFIEALLKQLDQRQDNQDAKLSALIDECRILRATLAEVAKIDDVVERLLDEIRRDKK